MARYHRRTRRRLHLRRGVALLALLLVVLAAGAWLGLWGREALVDKGCLALPEEATAAPLALEDPAHVRFAALGDTGKGEPLQWQVADTLQRVCDERGCDFVLLLGDNVYPSGLSSLMDEAFQEKVEAVYAPLHRPVYGVLGNHDVKGDTMAQVYRSLGSSVWRMPNVHYTFRAGPLRLFALNTNCGLLAYTGLKADLEREAPAPWTLALGHHTLVSSGAKAGESSLQRWYWNLTLAQDVDIYLSGHEHLLAHIDSQEQRTDYIISGGGGDVYSKNNPTPDAGRLKPLTQPFMHTQGGFVWFEISADTARWTFFDAAGTELYTHKRQR